MCEAFLWWRAKYYAILVLNQGITRLPHLFGEGPRVFNGSF